MPYSGAEIGAQDFDYSTPEGRLALKQAKSLVLEIRQELQRDPVARKVALYERSLGLAVLPILLRRGAYALWRRVGASLSRGR